MHALFKLSAYVCPAVHHGKKDQNLHLPKCLLRLQVDRIVAEREGEDGQPQYLVKWRGLAYDDATWETHDELDLPKQIEVHPSPLPTGATPVRVRATSAGVAVALCTVPTVAQPGTSFPASMK